MAHRSLHSYTSPGAGAMPPALPTHSVPGPPICQRAASCSSWSSASVPSGTPKTTHGTPSVTPVSAMTGLPDQALSASAVLASNSISASLKPGREGEEEDEEVLDMTISGCY